MAAVPYPARASKRKCLQRSAGKNTFKIRADIHQAADTAVALLRKYYGDVARADEDGSVFLCSGKGRFSLFGVYIVHLSILLLIAGAIIGSVFGVEGYVNIKEGEEVSAIHLRDNHQALSLPFSVRCDRFIVEFYENGAPKTFQSDLVF